MEASTEAIVAEFRNDLGGDLRLVGRYGPDDFSVLYVREDVERTRSPEQFQRLHDQMMRENLSSSYLEDHFDSGRLRSSVLGFEGFVAFNFLRADREGFVVTVDPDAEIELCSFLRKFETVAPVQERFGAVEFDVLPSDQTCPNCGSRRTISTPTAGPEAPYHCMDCDTPFG